MSEKSTKVPSAKALARKRTVATRKSIAKQIRAMEKVGKSFAKAQETLASEIAEVTGDVKSQLEQVLSQVGLAVTVVEAEIETQANALARTYLAAKPEDIA